MENIDKVKSIANRAPQSPGVYKMYDSEGKIIYIGKAKNLNKRIKQYFQKNYQHSTRTKKLLENMKNVEFVEVDSELEAMILEHNLIKQFLPKYNVIMKDDKNYVYIKITNEDFPRIQIVRKPLKDNAKYYGPKTASNKVVEIFKILKKLFPFRHCNLDLKFIKNTQNNECEVEVSNKTIKYPCLDYYIKTCCGPCIGKCNKDCYKEIINNVENFFKGKSEDLIKDLKNKMMELAQKKDFEKAAKIRDKIQKIEAILEKQKISDPNQTDKDIINYVVIQEEAYFNLFQIRNGKLIGQENFILKAKDFEKEENKEEVLEAFLSQYYEITNDLPEEILIPHDIENENQIKQLIKSETNKTIKFITPKAGDKNKLLELSLKNAMIYADRSKPSWKKESENSKNAISILKQELNLKEELKRIECYDISHLGGTDTVGSMVVFENGAPNPTMYRKFKLKTSQNTSDDYKSMEEVLTRRLNKIALEIKTKNYIFKHALKKHGEFINKTVKSAIERHGFTYKNFHVLLNKDKITGFVAITNINSKISKINALWVDKKERGKKLGYKILKEAISETRCKRIYLLCKQELKDYYLRFGFEEINKIPDEIQKDYEKIPNKENMLAVVYDKNKHQADESFSQIPNLIIIDGGKGQLKVCTDVMKNLGLKIPYISLAKEFEEIFIPNKKQSIILEKNNEALKLLQRIRDEAHRFAITYNKELRKKRMFH